MILFKDGPKNKLLTSFPFLLFSTSPPDTIFSAWTAILLEEILISNIWLYTATVEPQSVSKGSVSKSIDMVIINSKHTQNSLTPTSRHIFTAQKHAHRKHTMHKSKPMSGGAKNDGHHMIIQLVCHYYGNRWWVLPCVTPNMNVLCTCHMFTYFKGALFHDYIKNTFLINFENAYAMFKYMWPNKKRFYGALHGVHHFEII